MQTPTQHTHSPKKHYVHATRKPRAAQAEYRVISAADFLGDPKRAVKLAASGTQVCIQGGKAKIIFGSSQGRARAAQRPNRIVVATILCAGSTKTTAPLDVSWIE